MFPVSIQRYKFFYDISTPILVIIKDDNAFNGDGYEFMFAMESNIRSNKPMSPSMAISKTQNTQLTLFDDKDMWISGNITIEVIDNFGNPIEDVSVIYGCGPLTVNIGKTELNEEGKSVLVSRFPPCEGGLLGLSHIDYVGFKGIALDTIAGEEAYILFQT